MQKSVVFPHTNSEKSEKGILKNSIYNSIKKNKILKNALNQRGEKTCILKSTKHCWKKLKMIQINGKIFHTLELEEYC